MKIMGGEVETAPKPCGHGGHREGAGRKREGYIPKAGGDAAYARSLIRTVMRDEAQPMELRARCALAMLGSRGPGGKSGRKSPGPSE